MTWLIPAPFFLHGLLMVVDEVIHEKRGLQAWERRGHPLDSLTVMACFFFIQFFPPIETNVLIYLALAIFSTLFITKDEWVHHKECGAFEQWLHAVLFILHPIALFLAYYLWTTGELAWLRLGLPVVATVLFLYQLLRWNILWKQR
jgi:hypothetical protein